MQNIRHHVFKGIAMASVFFGGFCIFCSSKGPTESSPEPPPTKTTLSELELSSSDLPGWSPSAGNNDTFCIYPVDSLQCCAPGSIDGGATIYDSAGCKEVAYQTLTGPDPAIYKSYAMDFLAAGKATAMFELQKASKDSIYSTLISVPGFDTATAFATAGLSSITAYAHFNKYYFELAFMGVTDQAAGLGTASQFLMVIKHKIQ